MQGIGEGVLVWTVPDGTLSDCNEAAARLMGVTREELAGRTLDYPWQLTARTAVRCRRPSEVRS